MPAPMQAFGTAEPEPPPPEAVRRELANVIASKAFATSARLRRFLTYVVEETLAGRADSIKELVLGIEVFDRAGDFDPRADTIVRVEAVKLRKRLEEYYRDEGSANAIRIDIPKGGYIPRFHARGAAPMPRASEAPRPRWHYAAGVLLAVAIAASLTYWLVDRAGGVAPLASVAVLPFLDLSPDSAGQYFADGLAEELTDVLSGIGSLRVASRTSAFAFKGKQADVRDIGAKLRVAAVVEGSVRKDGERLRITAQLIRTDDGYHLWSRSFQRDLKEVFAIQAEIAQAIAAALEAKLTPAVSRRLKRERTASVRAFDYYLRGLSATAAAPVRGTNANEAERLLRLAIAEDPSYSRPYVALARLYLFGNIVGTRPTGELVGQARQAVDKALALDAEDAEAHAVCGSLAARHEYDWAAAERHLRDALRLDPHSAWARNTLAQDVLAPQERWLEAVEENRRAIELDPQSGWFAGGAPWLLYLQRQYDRSLEAARQLGPAGGEMLMSVLHAKGDHAGALAILEQEGQPALRPHQIAMLARIQADAGRTAEARKTLERLEQISAKQFVSPFFHAIVYAGLGEFDRGFEALERARKDQESALIFLRVTYLFDCLRADPRFAGLLAKIGLSDQQIQARQSLGKSLNR